MEEEARAVGWYGTNKNSSVARHWDGKAWSRPVPRKEFGPGVVINVDPKSGDSNPPHQAPPQMRLETWQTPTRTRFQGNPGPPSTNSLKKLLIPGTIVGVIGTFVLGSWLISMASDPRNNPSETYSNAKATCERLLEEKRGQKPRDIRSDVFEPSIHTYKMDVWVKMAPENELWTCRLVWNGTSWTKDTLAYG